MERIWQWAWDRFRARYSWAVYGITFAALLSVYLFLTYLIVAFERSDRYAIAATVCVVIVLMMAFFASLPGLGAGHLLERWAAGRAVDRRQALEATYVWTRTVRILGPLSHTALAATQFVLVSAAAGATAPRPARR